MAIDAQIQQTRQELAKAASVEPRAEEQRANSIRERLESQKACLEVDIASLQAKDHLLALAIAKEEQEFRVQNARLAEKHAALNRLTREAEIARNTFATISAKATEAAIGEGMKSGFVRVVDRTGARPARGMGTKSLLAGILGIMSGTMLTFILEYLGTPGPISASPRTARAVPNPTLGSSLKHPLTSGAARISPIGTGPEIKHYEPCFVAQNSCEARSLNR